MNLKNLNAKNKTPKFLKNYLKDKKISNIIKKFEINLKDFNSDFIVGVSGGPDSLALVFLSKLFAIKKKLKVKYYIVDHKLRRESTKEANKVRKVLNHYMIKSEILNWNGQKPKTKIQLLARKKRYELLTKVCKKNKINNIFLGHHLDDLFENFFIRILRGSGLNGLVSLDKKVKIDNLNFHRPLLDFEKKDLIYISKNIFNFFIEDPSNFDEKFKRIKIRNFLDFLKNEGLDKKKFLLTINNLKDSSQSIKFYVNKNLMENTHYLEKKNKIILSDNFFHQSHEVIFRSLNEVLKKISKKYYPVRGKRAEEIIRKVLKNSLNKQTLGGCIIEKVNKTVIISKET